MELRVFLSPGPSSLVVICQPHQSCWGEGGVGCGDGNGSVTIVFVYLVIVGFTVRKTSRDVMWTLLLRP